MEGSCFMNVKYRDLIFFLICFSLIFNNIPKSIQMNFIGGPVGDKLVIFPLIIGILYSVWCEWKYKNILVNKKVLINFLGIYFGVTFLSLIVGLAYYPFYGDIIKGPVAQIEKLPRVLHFLYSKGINVDAETLLPLWMIARITKGFLLEIFYTFVSAYLFYCWYRDEWTKGFKTMVKAILCSISILFVYSFFVEVPYLAGNETCKSLLESINPFIHSIKDDGKWWPPLLWPGQLRSVFVEPSYFGIYTAFAMPFLWYFIYKDRKFIGIILTFLLGFLLFLTKARTGVMLLLGEIILLIIFFTLFERKKEYIKKTGCVVLCILAALVSSNTFISTFMNEKSETIEVGVMSAMTDYIDNNAVSLINPDKRSNRARYSIMIADFKIGMDHPILGIGRGLRNGYIPQYLPVKGKENEDIKMWLAYREKLGILRSGFPDLGEYTVRFGETGMLGLLAFLMPVFFLIFSMIKNIVDNKFCYKLEYGIYLISLLGVMVSGIGDTLNITYCYKILLGLGYAMFFCKTGEVKDINERA